MANDSDSEHFVVLSRVRTGLKREFDFAMKAQSQICTSLGRTRSNKNHDAIQLLDHPTHKQSRKSKSLELKKENLTKEDVDVGDALSKEDPKNVMADTKELKSVVADIEEPKIQVGDEAIVVVGEEKKNNDEAKIEVVQMQMQSICDDGEVKEGETMEGDVSGVVSIGRFMQSTPNKKLDNGNSKVGSDGVEVKGGYEVIASTSVKMSKGSVGKKFPSKLKDLLSSGILEGLPVNYVRGMKAKATELLGVISGTEIVCYCEVCNGVEVVTPAIFELHAGSLNKRPAEHILLENRSTLRDVMNTFLNIPLGTLEEAMKMVLGGFIMKKSKFCVNCRDVNVVSRLFCNSCMVLKDYQPSSIQTTETGNNHVSVASQSRSLKPIVLPKSLNNGMKHSASRGKSQAKVTIKDLSLHKLVFKEDVLPNGTEVAYYARGKVALIIVYLFRVFQVNMFQKDKYVERNDNAKAAGRIEGIDPLDQINQKCIRIVKEFDLGGCTLCRDQDFSKSFGPRTIIICDQCEKEYHIGCLKDHNMQNLKELPKGNWFCCLDCNQIHTALVNLVACGEKNLPNSILSLIRKKYDDKGLEIKADLDIKWRVLNWKLAASDDNRQLLSKVVAIFHEQFDPIIHPTSGIDFIPAMLFGQVVVSVGIFRVFGPEVAELPLVATVTNFQGQGYFRSLFSCIESLLGSLKIKHFVLPATDEAKSIWTNKFGFTKLDQDEVNYYMKHYYMMMIFQGTSLLRKPVLAI
ncbi:Increased DNA methylation 1, partial [Mucuna pruriens]